MVLVQVTRGSGAEQCVLETSTKETVETVTRLAARVHNMRLRLRRLSACVRELAKYGPMKPEAERGMTEEQLNVMGSGVKEVPGADPLGMRVGQAPVASLQDTLNRVADEADAATSNTLADARKPTLLSVLENCLMNIRGAVMMAYPMKLPEWDPVRQNLDENEDLSQHADVKMIVDEASCVLWFAGKAMDRDFPLSKYVGSNEKVFVKAKLEPKNAGAPQRDPAVDEETRRKMMSFWHKKEQERKQMEEDDEDAYLNSAWANPKAFKQAMHGIGDVRVRPGMGF